jgi:SAM-dependent methyltransferase
MPTVEENLKVWNNDYHWYLNGDEWSEAWGSARAQWYGSIFPRVHPFLPASAVLEIAPGFGRWTEFLLGHCDTLIGIDVAPRCIEACRKRFADYSGASFEINDGKSVPMIADSSIDFVFSFDSLVHVEAEVLLDYLMELTRILKPDGVAFLHHSNYGAYRHSTQVLRPIQGVIRHLPSKLRTGLTLTGIRRESGWRAQSVSGASFAQLCRKAEMRCVGQELVNWAGGIMLQDAISIVTRPGSRWDRPNRTVKNWTFRSEARSIRRSSSVYETLGAPPEHAGSTLPIRK